MKRRKLFITIGVLVAVCLAKETCSQSDEFQPSFSYRGYLKLMPSAMFIDSNLITDNLIHHRLNLKAEFSENLNVVAEFRNRVFYGESVKANPYFGVLVGEDDGEVDLSWNIIDKNAVVLNSKMDRAYFEFVNDHWEVRIGRQRINWGVNLLWNANDLFNAYNFADFDYIERPGSDAIRVQHHTEKMQTYDIAYKPGKNLEESVIAGAWRFNKWQYDFQIIGANFFSDYAIGGGWAGNIKMAGFKGEGTYFIPKNNHGTETTLSSSLTVDYSFKNGMYLNGGFLFNQRGINDQIPISSGLFSTGGLSAKNLMPTKYSWFSQISGAFNPMVNGSIAVIYGQGMNILFVMPSIAYSIKENWDIDLTGQIFYGESGTNFSNLGNSVFLRLQWSY